MAAEDRHEEMVIDVLREDIEKGRACGPCTPSGSSVTPDMVPTRPERGSIFYKISAAPTRN